MRYIGSKEKIKDFIIESIEDVCGDLSDKIIADLFSGTTAIAQELKKKEARVITNDYMASSFVLQNALIKNNTTPSFKNLVNLLDDNTYEGVINYLNELQGIEGFIYKNYSQEGSANLEYQRNYFSQHNAKLIDDIRTTIQDWFEHEKITLLEFNILLASLIEAVFKVSNISGTYGAFLKVDDSRKFKKLRLEKIKLIESSKEHECYNMDIFDLLDDVKGDILYLDPPYNNRQYPAYYHLLETIALYDKPSIYGLTGRRPYEDMKSPFCVKKLAADAIERVIKESNFEHIFLSYSTDGIVGVDDMIDILSKYGEVSMYDKNHKRYKSNSFISEYDQLKEFLYYVRKRDKTNQVREIKNKTAATCQF